MRILILGGTGAMGIHVSHLLVQMGHQVVVTSRRQHLSENSDLTYRIGNAKDQLFLNGTPCGALGCNHRFHDLVHNGIQGTCMVVP